MPLSDADLNEFTQLLSMDLENGDTDKVVALFQYNTDLYETLGHLMSGGNMFVRLGINMVLEDLKAVKPEDMPLAIAFLTPLLKHENPTIRGDVADIFSIIGNQEQIELLKPLLQDEHPQVREMAEEAIEALMNSDEEE